MAHSIRGYTCGWVVKLCDRSLTRAILNTLKMSFIIRRLRYESMRLYRSWLVQRVEGGVDWCEHGDVVGCQ